MSKIILALDTADVNRALEITKKVRDKIFTVKLGLEFLMRMGKMELKNLTTLELIILCWISN